MFTKKLIFFSSICVALCGFLVIALLLDGPRIRKTEYDLNKLTQNTNQTLVFKANQPIKSVNESQISINPSADFSVATTGESIVLQLKQRLNYSSNYTIEIKDIEANNGKKTNFQTKFTTLRAEFYYLKRATAKDKVSGINDKIIDSKTNQSIYEDEMIYDFDLAQDRLIVHHGLGEQHEISVVDLASGKQTFAQLPGGIEVDNLQASPAKPLFGFTITNKTNHPEDKQEYNNTLFMYDIEAKMLFPVKAFEDKPVSVINWNFSPDGTTVLAQTYDSGTMLIDTNGEQEPIPLGTFNTIGNFSGDGSTISLTDPVEGSVLMDVKDKSKTKPSVSLIDGLQPYLISVRMLSNGEKLLRQIDVVDSVKDYYKMRLDVGAGDNFKQLYEFDSDKEDLVKFTTSSNDQYLAMEVSQKEGNYNYDKYTSNSKPRNTKTKILNTMDGSVAYEVYGFNIIWKK